MASRPVYPVTACLRALFGKLRSTHHLDMTLYFRNKVAVVTGGASGLGLALCEALLNRQAQVVLADIDGEAAQQQAERLQHGAAQLRAVPLDVTQLAAVKALISDVVRQFGRVDLMFNNAGIGGTLPYPQATREHWERIVQLNLWGVIHGTEAAFGQMKQQGSGQIVNTSSIADLIPFPGHVLYTTTKYAVVGPVHDITNRSGAVRHQGERGLSGADSNRDFCRAHFG